MKPVNMIIIVAVAAVISFLAGVKYQGDKQTTTNQPSQTNQAGQFNRQGRSVRAGNNRPVIGQILNVEDSSITVKLQDGSSKIVILSASTNYSQSLKATKDDLKVGEQVGAFGTTNSDGTVTTTNVQINPQFRNMTVTPTK